MKIKLFKKRTENSRDRDAARRPFYMFSLLILFLSFNPQAVRLLPGQQGSTWSVPQTIPGYDPATISPILIADQNRTVHAFSTQWINNPGEAPIRTIVYNQWTLENGWTNPLDIILSPNREARLTDVYLDKNGIFHLTFYGGDNTKANIYYTKAPAVLAADSRAWSVPVIVGEDASDPEGAAIVENKEGAIIIVYNGRKLGNGLYVVTSKDGGENWSNPTPMFFAQSDRPNISRLDVMESKSGKLHAVWGLYSEGGQGRGIYYAGSDDGIQWSEPFQLASTEDGLGSQTPAIIEYKDSLIALFNLPPKIMMRRSTDGGKTWDAAAVLFPRHVGVNGSISPVVDGNNELHLFFGQRISGSPDIHGMWHSILNGNRWTEPNAVVKGPRIWDTEGLTSFDPYEARAVVSQGNVILVTWITDLGDRKPNGVFYSYSVLDAPESPVVTLPAASIPDIEEVPGYTAVAANPAHTATEAVEAVPAGMFEQDPQDQQSRDWIVIGVFILVILGLGYFIFVRGR
jgi:hypothetical protein